MSTVYVNAKKTKNGNGSGKENSAPRGRRDDQQTYSESKFEEYDYTDRCKRQDDRYASESKSKEFDDIYDHDNQSSYIGHEKEYDKRKKQVDYRGGLLNEREQT